MRKSLKNLLSIVLTLGLLISCATNVNAETFSWSASKTPGTTKGSTAVQIPIYKGKMTFMVTKLSGDCSYLLGKCVSINKNYYINNSEKSVMITKVGGAQSFYMRFLNGSELAKYFYLVCSVEHNAYIGDTVSAVGVIYY